MISELEILISSMDSGPLKEMAMKFLNSRFFLAYCTSPAAQHIHQNYSCGLLEHSLGAAQICLQVSRLHKEINRDLLIIGALFHDIGKIMELRMKAGIYYTDEGKLLGHTILGIQILSELMDGIDMPETLRMQVLHMGRRELYFSCYLQTCSHCPFKSDIHTIYDGFW